MPFYEAKRGRTYEEITSTTYERWLTRQHNKFDSWWNSNQSSNSHAGTSSRLKPPFDYIVDRVKREHPGKFKNNLEARVYARKHDPVGRRYERLRKQGVEPARMANRVTGGQSLRANGGQLMRSLKYARRHATATRYTLLRFRNAKMKRGSFGSSGG